MGGEVQFNTKLRDWGCSALIVIGLGIACGFSWYLVAVFFCLWGAFCLGDYGKFQWSVHALAVVLATLPYAWSNNHWNSLYICLATVPLFTYITSRYLRFYDIIARGALFGSIPMVFKIFS